MTPRPQPEYIITEFQLKQLQDFASLEFVCQAIRTRPHTPAPAPDIWPPEQLKEIAERCDAEGLLSIIQQNRNEAARTATLKTLDKIEQYAENMRSKREDGSLVMSYPIYPDDLDELVESLRQQAGEQG